MNDHDLLDAYRATMWTGVTPSGAAFRCVLDADGAGSVRRVAPADTFAIVTAWNPGSRRLPDEENRARNRALEADLVRLGATPVPCVGVGRDGWSEPSFLVPGLVLPDALALGLRYEQNAVVWIPRRGPPRLLVTRDGFAGAAAGSMLDADGRAGA